MEGFIIQVSEKANKIEKLKSLGDKTVACGHEIAYLETTEKGKPVYHLYRKLTAKEKIELEKGIIKIHLDNIVIVEDDIHRKQKSKKVECECLCCGKKFIGYNKRKKAFCHNCKDTAARDVSDGAGVSFHTRPKGANA